MNIAVLGNCLETIKTRSEPFTTTFLDPPFNQDKEYRYHDDDMISDDYWNMMKSVCKDIYSKTVDGGSLYFMQREKNAEQVLRVTRESGWFFQNLLIWKKWTGAAAPSNYKHPKHYQIIAFVTKGNRPKTFNKLRIDPPLLSHHKYERENGMFVTDLWDDIKELTSGYFSGDEAIRLSDMGIGFVGTKQSSEWATKHDLRLEGIWTTELIKDFLKPEKIKNLVSGELKDYTKDWKVSKKEAEVYSLKQVRDVESSQTFIKKIGNGRFHEQQSPLALLVRIILTSTMPGDWVLDPFAGTGTTGCVAKQLNRNSVCIELDPENVKCIENRTSTIREPDNIKFHKECYNCTENFDAIWQ